MNRGPEISVVIPTYNRATVVPRTIESVLCQTCPPAEIIVVNDGSKDETKTVLASFGNGIRAIHKENGGVSTARNTGIEAAESEWIAFLDDDDEYVPDRLRVAADAIALHPEVNVHATNIAIVNPDGSELDLYALRGRKAEEHMPLERPLDWVLQGCFFSQSLVVRKRTALETGLFRNMFYEDLDFFVRLAVRGPWTVDCRKSLRLIRRPGEDMNLSTYWRSRPIENFEALMRIHREALTFPSLDAREKGLLRSGLGTNLFELGQALMECGRNSEARLRLQEAAQTYPRLHSRLKARMVAAGGVPIIKLLEMARPRKGKYRSATPN